MTKLEVVQKISDYEIPEDFLMSVDKDLLKYVKYNLEVPEEHNKYEILGVLRFLDFLKRPDLEFRDKEVRKFYVFYKSLKFESPKGMKNFELTPVQKFQVANILGFYIKDTEYRLCRDALLFVPRKFAKSTMTSSFAIYALLFGSPDSQSYIASTSFSQSQIMFSIIKHTLQELDPKLKSFKLNRDIIHNLMKGKTSFIRCLSNSALRLDGLNPDFCAFDEQAANPSAELRNVLTSGQGARTNPLNITLTTASTLLDSPFVGMLNNYKKMLEGEIQIDTVFASIFQPDVDDDLGSPITWKKCNPHIGVTIDERFYPSEWEKAQLSAEDMSNFKTKLLNVFCLPTNQQWVNPKVIERNTQHFDFTHLKSRPNAMVSVDLSVKDDFSCVCYTLYDSINKRFIFKNNYYIPKQTIETHPNRELYQRLVDEGHLIICGDDVIDYKMIANDIIGNGKYLNILQIGYDAYRSKEFINIIKASGIKCAVPYSQTYSNFTSPIESFELAVHQDRLKFDDNPLNLYCINNVAIDIDKMENKKPIKKTNNDKIDGAICMLMCLGMFNNYKR